jgi:hypothetical protein
MKRREPWTQEELARLRRLYPRTLAKQIATTRHPIASVYRKAAELGLRQDADFKLRIQQQCGRSASRSQASIATRYPKGHVPQNKGLRRPGWHRGRMRETQFKKGQFPFNRDPEFYVPGALRVNADGYIDMRIRFAPGALGWRALHRIIWEDAHGKVRPNQVIIFKDGDRLNVELPNLQLLTRGELMLRNSIRNLPPLLKSTIHVLGQLKRRIHEKQDAGFTRPSVRHSRSSARPRQPDGPRTRDRHRKDGSSARELGQGRSRLREGIR